MQLNPSSCVSLNDNGYSAIDCCHRALHIVPKLSRQLNLHFHAARRHCGSEVERLHGVIKSESVRDERLHINLSSAHHGTPLVALMRLISSI